MFLAPRTVYVLPFVVKGDGESVHTVVRRMIHIASQVSEWVPNPNINDIKGLVSSSISIRALKVSL